MLPSPAVNLLCEKAIKAIAAGKPEEIGVIYDHTYRLIYSVAYGVLQNHGDAEDAAQETLCEILRCASSYQGGSAKGWILSIARHKEIASLLGSTAASAEKHYQRGLEKLRSYYGEGRKP